MTVTVSSMKSGALPPPPPLTCNECGDHLIEDEHSGQVVCTGCGVVYQQYFIVDQDRQWGPEDERAARDRLGGPINLGEATLMGAHRVFKDIHGNRLMNPARWAALQRWNSQVLRANVRGEITGRNEVGRVVAALDLPPAAMEAATTLFSQYYHRESLSGYTMADGAAAAIYVTCRQQRVATSFDEIAQTAGASRTTIYRMVARLCMALHIRMPQEVNCVVGHLERIGTKLHVSHPVVQAAQEVAVKARLRLRQGLDPSGIAAAILYLACIQGNDKRAQQEIAEVAGVTEVTLRTRVKDVRGLFPRIISNNKT